MKHVQRELMKAISFLGFHSFLLILIAFDNAFSQPAPQYIDRPHFYDHQVDDSWRGRHAEPVLNSSFARNYRTRLRETALQLPNFAGHYTVGLWGCGTSCLMGAIVDLNTGSIVEIPFTICCHDADGMNSGRVEYYANSDLIIFRGLLDEQEPLREAHYRLVAGNLQLVAEYELEEATLEPELTTTEYSGGSNSGQTFGGYECLVDCSGHEAGYEWAMENDIAYEADCEGKSQSFVEGCYFYVEENY